jgi:hypothetical protein
MGTSSSSSGPKGKTQLLPSWATGDNNMQDQDQNSGMDGVPFKGNDSKEGIQHIHDPLYSLTGAKGVLKRIANNRTGANFKNAAKNYVRKTGGHKKATRASAMGVTTGTTYLGFFTGVAKDGLERTLRNYDLSDCIGKSTDEVLAKIANKIAPIGSTNDEAIARVAVMVAFDKLYEKLLENGQDINSLDHLDEETLRDVVIEYVSAYIFKKWVYEAGLALERNDLSESEAIELENEMRVFVTDEIRSGLAKIAILSFDITKGEGRKVVENIFDLAYSTLEK